MKNKAIVLLILIIMLTLTSCSLLRGMDNLPQGELMETVISPDGTYTINSFLVNGGATVAYCVRCEVVENISGEKRNIYWEYRCESADIEWIDNTTVQINGRRLNVITDSYDWRNYPYLNCGNSHD